MFDQVYAIPTYICNLNCPHCEIHKIEHKVDCAQFLKQLQKIEARKVILFGGEPLVLPDEYIKQIIQTGKITSISTNLFSASEDILKEIVDNKIAIATSWNRKRFSLNQELNWYLNILKVKRLGAKVDVLITLTEDLITEDGYTILKIVLETLEKTNGVNGVLFEHYIGPEATKEYQEKADDFLCKIHKEWNYKFNNFIIDRLENWNCNCANVATLEPDGNLKMGCPQYQENNLNIREECLTCSLANICNPCYLQHTCSFPKKLYHLVKEEENGSCTR